METAEQVRQRQSKAKRFTDDEQRAGLELAAVVGVQAAARQLKVGRKTIYRWAEKHPKLWSGLRAGNQEAHTHGFAARIEDLADEYTAAEMLAVEQAVTQIKAGELDAKELAALIKAMGSSRGIAAGNARAARGEVETVDHNINFPQIEAAIERLLGAGGAGELEDRVHLAPPVVIEGSVEDA